MPSVLLQKSEENFNSASFLLHDSKKHYNSSAQCSYYGCLQIIKHLLIYEVYGSEEEIIKKLKEYKAEGKSGNSHAFYISTIYKRLKSDGYRTFANTFNEHMVILKTLREKSAYGEVSLDIDQSKDALVKSADLVKSLKSFYKL